MNKFEEPNPSPKREPSPEELYSAGAVLIGKGVRLMQLEGQGHVVGIWQDTDCLELRAAIAAFGADQPIRLLDDADIPSRYKIARVASEDRRRQGPEPVQAQHQPKPRSRY